MELRALCNEVPRTPPGPEGSNGIGIASGAADHPRFLERAVQTKIGERMQLNPNHSEAQQKYEWLIKS
jgi:hypothetical protein